MGRGWAWMLDTFPMFLTTVFCALLLIITYTSIGLALSSVSRGKFFPGIALLAVLLGTKTLAAIVEGLFDRSILYLISPYDSVAHVGQALIGKKVNENFTLDIRGEEIKFTIMAIEKIPS